MRTNADNARVEGFAKIVTINDLLSRFTDTPPSGGVALTDSWVMPTALIEMFARRSRVGQHCFSYQVKLMSQIVTQNRVGRYFSIGNQAHRDGAWYKKVKKSLIKIMP